MRAVEVLKCCHTKYLRCAQLLSSMQAMHRANRGFGPASTKSLSAPRHARLCSLRCRSKDGQTTTLTPQSGSSISASPASLVDSVLELVKDSDGGISMPDEKKAEVDALLDQLEAAGAAQQPRPIQNPLLWGNYNVAYTSTRRAPSERGQPAGGRFRGWVGRTLFRTTGLFQSCLEPDLATNKVSFKLFGFINGHVGLRGTITPLSDVGNNDTVRVRFEPTVLSFGPLHLRLGMPSEVQLATTYLDERVRLGKGSRGSLFVFTRGGAADEAEMDKVGRQSTSPATLALACCAYVGVMLGALAAWLLNPSYMVRVPATLVMLLGAGVASVLRNGGIIVEDQSQAMRQASDKAAQQAASQSA